MATEIKVPVLGESVTTATVARWIKQPGDAVAADEAVVELETDKVSVEVAAPEAGVLGPLAVQEGEEVAVGAVLTTIEAGGVQAGGKAPDPAAKSKPASAAKEATPATSASPAKAAPPAPTAAPAAPAKEVGDTDYDLIVIGSGPGGYVCALRAAQLGLKTACVEKRATLGGTCLNIGCIPSKALLQSSENFHEIESSFAQHGIMVEGIRLDLARMHARKAGVVDANVKGVEFLFKKNGVTWLKGAGKITGPNHVEVDGKSFSAKNIVIATGSDSIGLPGIEIDEKRIVTSTGALELGSVPKHLVVIGAGVIGLELGSVWHRLGAEVTVVEYLDRIVPGLDNEIAKSFQRVLDKQGLKFRLGSKVTKAETTDKGVTLTVEPAKGGEATTIEADVVLVAIGRRAVSEGVGLEDVGVELDDRKRVKTDAHYATNIPSIHAIGDVISGPMLAHKAEDEGVALAEILAGQAGHVNYGVIPSVVYTWPEVAAVGRSEEELKADGVAYTVGKFPFTANGRARAMAATDGFVKILADKKTDRILGAHILGPDAGTLIAELATAMEFGASSEDVARICHAHPTLNEAVKEAALAVEGRALHI
ncbi:dihydrolipoyl dehydrogenase [Lichenicoccus roseus]|uniref:Dihydrolipoyl dehydrogenase n=1 Tax=Lichenicoccus roseus TaxID=2683649 RepID=A0A5R9J869_9PROT|nr:dihydrolipoyl dehydrogenase [Lichenicoccus roseus]TLU73169.1 dihydrolipoyl dehydrogenase [Lichenicoccus roseus]